MMMPYLTEFGTFRRNEEKLTLRDLHAARWQRSNMPEPRGPVAALAYLMGSPADAPRESLSDRVPFSAKTLDRMTRKYLSLSPEFQRVRKPYWWNETPSYEKWLCSIGLSAKEARAKAARDNAYCRELAA
jgi:hypothetical protein